MLGASISYPHPESCEFSASTATQQDQSRTERRSNNIAMATCYQAYELSPPQRTVQVPVQKDYSRPLHVDCSVEYELPNTAKPPQGVRNEPLLMIHPCYFRKIESQRRSPFVNNLPTRQPTTMATTVKRRVARAQPAPQLAAQYPVQYQTAAHDRQQQQQQQIWDQLPPLLPISHLYNKKEHQLVSSCGTYNSSGSDSGHWTDPDRSPDRPDDKQHILTGKYRQYLRAHRLHPYVTSAIPLASTFPQIQQVCYNV